MRIIPYEKEFYNSLSLYKIIIYNVTLLYVKTNQYVTINIEVPKNLSNAQKEILKQFDEACEGKNYKNKKNFFDKMKDLFK